MSKPFERTVGRYTISKITELELTDFSPARLFPEFGDQATDPKLFPPGLLSPAGNIILSSHSWLISFS
ncbi:hypothetical protein [Rhizobium straminoryzae]|uniref:Uncharacterized protein n=1 Tax=Rhizobium straminoryzae TaxID=1387186 RepID=A0A549T120_9HYPH|nr:hypothetical protein [Rhizobium straminoryzae]TRL35573.1 hypothetical protein FNA46_19845 [Rhizobium straminoryzae]